MVHRFFKGISDFVSDFVHRPARVLVVCLTLIFFGLVIDGTLFRLWSLYRDAEVLEDKIKHLSEKSSELKMKIHRSKDQGFIELQARDRLELAAEGDLIFVFADEEQTSQSFQ